MAKCAWCMLSFIRFVDFENQRTLLKLLKFAQHYGIVRAASSVTSRGPDSIVGAGCRTSNVRKSSAMLVLAMRAALENARLSAVASMQVRWHAWLFMAAQNLVFEQTGEAIRQIRPAAEVSFRPHG